MNNSTIPGYQGTVITNSDSTLINTASSKNIHIQGDAVFEGDIKWQGRNMREWFESIESRLSLLRPNPDLEREWSELAELRQRYVELERNILAKQELYNILKKI